MRNRKTQNGGEHEDLEGRVAEERAKGGAKAAENGEGARGEAETMTAETVEARRGAGEAAQKAEKEAQIADLTQDLQRTRADFENFRRRVEERQEAAKKAAELSTVFKLLPLLDDLGRAIGAYQELAPLKKSLGKAMKELGLVLVEAGPGTEFNPDMHEAVSAEGEGEKEVIGEVLREGYWYGGELLRPAMVRVERV